MELKKDKGYIEYSLSVMLIIIATIVILYGLTIRMARMEKVLVEDALDLSNLASAVVDTHIYGETEKLSIDATEGYGRFKSALKTNLNLDDSLMPNNTTFMDEPVKIIEYHVYNVDELTGEIEHITIGESGAQSMEIIPLSGATTPDGTEIESTTVYSKIEFTVKGFLGQRLRETLEDSADIVKN